jgi:two-component system response regulator
LVEDNPNDIFLTERAFKKSKFEGNNYKLDFARDGIEAVEYLNTNSLPKFVLLDLKLPRMNGFEVLKYIRSKERTKLVPVIVLTSSTEKQDINRSYSLGANGYINKPVDFIKFQKMIKIILSYWLILNENPEL